MVSIWPRLELAIEDSVRRVDAEEPAAHERMRSMQPDPLVPLRVLWQPPDAEALARAWQQMVMQDQAPDGVSRPASAGPLPVTQFVSPLARWVYPAYSWAGLHVFLAVVGAQYRQDGGSRRQRKRTPLALRLEAHVPRLGRVGLHVQLAAAGVQIIFVAADPVAQDLLARARQRLLTTLRARGVRVVHVAVLPRLSTMQLPTARSLEHRHQDFPVALFAAAANVAVVTAQFLSAEKLGPAVST